MWKDIEGFEGIYQVSDDGDIRSVERWIERVDGKLNHILERIVKTSIINSGYPKVGLHKNNVVTNMLVHSIVARAYPEICGEWFEGCEVDHINTIKTDNRAINLRVVSHKENLSNPLTKNRLGMSKNHPSISKSVEQLTIDGKHIKTYPSISEAGRQTGICIQQIYSLCKGNGKTAGGYYWRYAS